MANVYLSANAEKLLCEIYQLYLKKLKSGITQQEAKNFPMPSILQESLSSEWNSNNLELPLLELNDNQCFSKYMRHWSLNNKGIEYIQEHFPDITNS